MLPSIKTSHFCKLSLCCVLCTVLQLLLLSPCLFACTCFFLYFKSLSSYPATQPLVWNKLSSVPFTFGFRHNYHRYVQVIPSTQLCSLRQSRQQVVARSPVTVSWCRRDLLVAAGTSPEWAWPPEWAWLPSPAGWCRHSASLLRERLETYDWWTLLDNVNTANQQTYITELMNESI